MPTTRRDFIKRGVTAASAGLFVNDGFAAADECKQSSSSELNPHPSIHVQFSGLFVYQFRNSICDVQPLQGVRGHDYKLQVLRRDKFGNMVTMEEFPGGEPKNHLVLKVNGAQNRVTKYEPGGPDLDRSLLDNDCQHWGWTLNLKKDFLPKDAPVPEFHLWPGLQIANGIFYTAVKTTRAEIKVTKKASIEFDLYSISSCVGVNIYFDEKDTGATLDWGPGAKVNPVKMDNIADVTYEISVKYEPKVSMKATRNGTKSHFYRYYEKMKANKPKTVYDVFYYDKTLLASTPDVPCMGLEI